jgi:uncharacterized protein YjbI with pentapeptide repeats
MGTDFSGARLVEAMLMSVVVLGGQVTARPVFAGADLCGARVIAEFPGVDLRRARLRGANLGVDIRNQGMGQMRTDLSNANLSNAVLAGADFNRSLMTFCNLRGANLRGANFFRVKLGGADLTGADVTGANFTEADLEATVFRDAKGFADAVGLDKATNASSIRR